MDIEKELSFFLGKCQSEKFCPNTVTNYKSRVKAFLKYFEKKNSPEDVTLEEFKKYLNATLSPNTINTNIVAVKSFYLLTGRTGFDFSGFHKTARKKQPRFIVDEKNILKLVSKNLGVKESQIHLIQNL